MNSSELIKEVSIRTGYTIESCREIIHDSFDVIIGELEAHGSIRIPDLGTFSVYDRKPRKIHHPKTGELISAGGDKYPRFIPSQNLKQRVNS